MVLNVEEIKGGEHVLDALLARASQDMANDGPIGHDEPFIVITPARLRPYVERHVLAYLGDHPVSVPGVTLAVHSFTSMARSVVGNHYDGRYAKPVMNPFTIRAFLASRMHLDSQTFRAAGDTFGSANQFASQVIELINAGIRPNDITRMSDADDRMRAVAKLLAWVEDEFGDFTMPGANASVIVPWIEDHGAGLHVYLYGFEQMTADEMLITARLADATHCVLYTEASARPDFVGAIACHSASSGHIGLPDMLPNLLKPAMMPTAYYATDECDEIRQVATSIDALHDQAELNGTPFSYGDILVTARNLGPYQAMLEDEFSYHGIPVNATPVATMADQPFADLLLGLLDERLYKAVPNANALLRVFRSRLLRNRYRISNRDIDSIQDALYTADPIRVWNGQTDSAVVNKTAARMHALIDEARPVFMDEDDAESPRTVRETLTGMVRFLVHVGANLSWTDIASDGQRTGEPAEEQSRREAQQRLFSQTRTVWNLVMREFNVLVERFGDESFANFRPTFADNLETLLLEQPLHDVARASNAVDVVALPTSMRPYTHVFVLGASESQLPAIPGETGLLDESERLKLADALEHQGKSIAAAGIRLNTMHGKARREILAFNRLMDYADNLSFLCPRTSGGAVQVISPFAAELLPGKRDGRTDRTRKQTIDDLTKLNNGTPHSLTLQNANAEPLDPALMLNVFTKHADPADPSSPLVFDTSVSAIEQFYKNPFESFLNRGLRLQPVQPFELTPAIQGSFYHAVLERLIDVTIAAQCHADDLAAIPSDYRNGNELKTDSELVDLLAQLDYVPEPIDGSTLATTSLIEENPNFVILASSQRMRAIHEQLKDTLHMFLRRLKLTVESWQDILTYGPSSPASGSRKKQSGRAVPSNPVQDTPMFTEKQFGDIHTEHADWPALTSEVIVTGADAPVPVTVRVRGKVDRIDGIERDGHEGALVIDYKSSGSTLFDSKEAEAGSRVYYGHELQLLTYARAMTTSGEVHTPIAGLVFLPIRLPKSEDADETANLTAVPGDITQARRLCDTGLSLPTTKKLPLNTAGVLIQPWQRAKSDSVLPSRTLEPSELQSLVDYVRRMIDQACEAMLNGTMPVAPYKTVKTDNSTDKNSGNSLKYSDYAEVIALDMLDDKAWRMQRPVSFMQLCDTAQSTLLPDVIGTTENLQQEVEQ